MRYLFRGFCACKDGDKMVRLDGKNITGKWVYGLLTRSRYYSKVLTCIVAGDESDALALYGVNEATVGQWTGIEDITGQKIFEGDVVISGHNTIGTVVWNEDACSFFVNIGDDLMEMCECKYEVIGNIYEAEEE